MPKINAFLIKYLYPLIASIGYGHFSIGRKSQTMWTGKLATEASIVAKFFDKVPI